MEIVVSKNDRDIKNFMIDYNIISNIFISQQVSMWAKLVGFTAIASLSGLAYIRYLQMDNYNKKVQAMTDSSQLRKYLFNAAEQSSYFIDDIMNNFEQEYNISHINRYKSTLLKFVEGKTLETCAGSNRNLKFYPPATDLTLIDWSPRMVAVGVGKSLPAINYRYIIGDVTSMPFKDNQFDTVVDIFGLQHVIEPQKALSEIRRCLFVYFRVCKKDGTILLMNQGLSSIVQFHYWQNAISGQKLCNMGVFTNRNWEKILKQFDFEVQLCERKKNGKIYIYVLKNKKEGLAEDQSKRERVI